MKKESNITNTSLEDLEDKIVEISLKNKRLTAELDAIKNNNSKVISKLIHNLKNPIGSSFSFSEMLIENSDAFDAEKTKKYLSIIKKSSHYAIEILNSFAKLSSIKSTNFELNISNANYSSFVANILEKCKSKYADNNINFNIDIQDNIFCNFDSLELSYCVEELINNAVRFSPINSAISITIEKSDKKVVTTIIDNGIGIEAQNPNVLFEEFYVENTYDVHQNKCLGLGLTCVKKIIDLHKGTISIKNNPPSGTVVKLILPA